MKIHALFPGQGSQVPGMGRSLARAHPEADACFDEAAAHRLGVSLRTVTASWLK